MKRTLQFLIFYLSSSSLGNAKAIKIWPVRTAWRQQIKSPQFLKVGNCEATYTGPRRTLGPQMLLSDAKGGAYIRSSAPGAGLQFGCELEHSGDVSTKGVRRAARAKTSQGWINRAVCRQRGSNTASGTPGCPLPRVRKAHRSVLCSLPPHKTSAKLQASANEIWGRNCCTKRFGFLREQVGG